MSEEKIVNITQQAETFEIVVDDGYKKIPIKNLYGEEIGVFYFNPTDIGIVERYRKFAKDFEKITEPFEKEAPEGVDETEFTLSCYDEATKRLYAACNELLGGDFASAFFGRSKPWTATGGKFYCEDALEKVGKFIEKQFDVELDKISSRVAKYTNRAQRRAKKK